MSTTIAHEINNPLTGLIGFLQLTKSRLEKNDTLDEKGVQKTLTSIEKCIEQSQRIKTIVQKMRQISKPKLKMYGSTQIVDMDTQTKPKKK
jgi:signal transduction histidine kinase